MRKTQRTLLAVIVVAIIVLLSAVAAIVIPILTHESSGGSGQVAPEGYVAEVSATGDDGRTRTLNAMNSTGDPADLSQLVPGDELVVEGSGFDASIGIYVAFCKIPEEEGGKPGPCLGGIPEDANDPDAEPEVGASAWVTSNWAWQAFATDAYTDTEAGTFSVRIQVPGPTEDLLDCAAEACGLFTRADHTASADRVQDVYLPVAFTE